LQINLSTRQLRAFVALAEQRNFTRAAALTHLSQPAFSALIRSLEDALGQRLFECLLTGSVRVVVYEIVCVDANRFRRDVGQYRGDIDAHVIRGCNQQLRRQ